MRTPDRIKEAVRIVSNIKHSHKIWLKWYSQHPNEEHKFAEVVGSKAHHEKWIQELDTVISVLGSLGENS